MEQEEMIKCDICSKEFNSKAYLNKHLPIHDENRKMKNCTICDKKVFDLKQHIKKIHKKPQNPEKYKCEYDRGPKLVWLRTCNFGNSSEPKGAFGTFLFSIRVLTIFGSYFVTRFEGEK